MDDYKQLTRNGLRSIFMELTSTAVKNDLVPEEQHDAVIATMRFVFAGLCAINDKEVEAFNKLGENDMAMALASAVFPDPQRE